MFLSTCKTIWLDKPSNMINISFLLHLTSCNYHHRFRRSTESGKIYAFTSCEKYLGFNEFLWWSKVQFVNKLPKLCTYDPALFLWKCAFIQEVNCQFPPKIYSSTSSTPDGGKYWILLPHLFSAFAQKLLILNSVQPWKKVFFFKKLGICIRLTFDIWWWGWSTGSFCAALVQIFLELLKYIPITHLIPDMVEPLLLEPFGCKRNLKRDSFDMLG